MVSTDRKQKTKLQAGDGITVMVSGKVVELSFSREGMNIVINDKFKANHNYLLPTSNQDEFEAIIKVIADIHGLQVSERLNNHSNIFIYRFE